MKKIQDFKNAITFYKEFAKVEASQTKEMLIVFRDLLHKELGGNKNPTQEEIQNALEQLKDVGKISVLIPLALLPASIITIPLLVKIGKRYGVDILPKN
jgi:ubiquitin C-terminal hydrolase